MDLLTTLSSKQGKITLIGYDFDSSFENLTERGEADCFIISTEDGFSPLGAAKAFFSKDLGISKTTFQKLANWNRFENYEFFIMGLPSHNPSSRLRGVILAPSETSKCYEQFAPAFYGKPYRDFYYNVTYESISYASNVLGAKKIAMSHLSGSGHFHEDIATCTVEALTHFCNKKDSPAIESFLFIGCCIEKRHLLGIESLNLERNLTKHRDIHTHKSSGFGFDVISFNWR